MIVPRSILDDGTSPPQNACIAFNSAIGLGNLKPLADSRSQRHFLRPNNATVAPSMVGSGGDALGHAGFLEAGFPTPLLAHHPRLETGRGYDPTQEQHIMANHVPPPSLCPTRPAMPSMGQPRRSPTVRQPSFIAS